MNELNSQFFEEYKSLEKICNEMYERSYGGITNYINDMENTSWRQSYPISNWESDLKKLKRVRHLRNNLAHNTDAFDEENCTQEDIQFVKDFHQRIINGTDPLQINLNKEEDEQISFDDRSYDRTESKNEKYVILTVCSFIIIVIVVIILILI